VESSEIRSWRRIEKIDCADLLRNEEVLQKVKKERNILQTTKRIRLTVSTHLV
jgi:hypothetical protein